MAPSQPTVAPSVAPSGPSIEPTVAPSIAPSQPTVAPSGPTNTPTVAPSGPTDTPTVAPSGPSIAPTAAPSQPTETPTAIPSGVPTAALSQPSVVPTVVPSQPTITPSCYPTKAPSNKVVISTIAGNGDAYYSGDNGDATSATIHGPTGILCHSSGDIFFSDSFNNRIRKITVATGIITTFAGTGTGSYSGDNGLATSAAMNLPYGLAQDTSGKMLLL